MITGSNSEIKFWKKENEKWVIDSNYKDIKCESQVVDIIKINDNEIMSYCKNSFDFWKIESGKEHTKIINIPTSCGWPYNSLLITMNENIYLTMWIVLVLCDIFLGKSYINAYFDADDDKKKKCIKVLFEVIVSVIAGSVFFAMLILLQFLS